MKQATILTSLLELSYNLITFFIDVVSHTCIPNEEVGGARNVYIKKFNIPI